MSGMWDDGRLEGDCVKRVRRHLFTLCSVVSPLLCVAVCWVSVSSHRGSEHSVSWLRSNGSRYTLRAESGGFALLRPPTPYSGGTPIRDGRTAEQLVTAIRNDEVKWEIEREQDWFFKLGPPVGHTFLGNPHADDTPINRDPYQFLPTYEIELAAMPGRTVTVGNKQINDVALSPATLNPWLLRALEDPERFVAAHYLLVKLNRPRGLQSRDYAFDPETLTKVFADLRVTLRETGRDVYTVNGAKVFPCSAEIDPAQFPAIRDGWHRQFNVAIVSIAWWQAMAAALMVPVTWSGTRIWACLHSYLNGRNGLCPSCGYDLRASLERCPECGMMKSDVRASA
jgi:hypothetical protein